MAEAFPGPEPSNAVFGLRQFRFPRKAANFVRRNSDRFDVVDAVLGSLSGTKRSLGFDGLLVARSVGLFRLYQRVEQEAHPTWPSRPRGKLFGRVLYGGLRSWSNRVSHHALRNADVVNVPNEEEADCTRNELGVSRPVIVQPYGLTAEQSQALREAAARPSARLAHQRICFIGMWAPRKGSFDWPAILQAVWRRVPGARFRFLGAMVDEEKVRADLSINDPGRLEIIPRYPPGDLPKLLSDCAAGAFPSYIEGFGLGVLEQLAAGIPTVAFDVPGPRTILRTMPEFLVPAVDSERFAARLCDILQLDEAAYEALCSRAIEAASVFDWEKIATVTISTYRKFLAGSSGEGKILFVQPFSVGSSGGGGGRILRSLLEHSPLPWHSVCCSPRRPRHWPNESHIPSRPSWGKLEASRLARFPHMTASAFAGRFRRRLKSFALKSRATAVHTVPHSGLDFTHAQAVARDLGLPFFVSLHDDIVYTTARELRDNACHEAMSAAWREAEARFVISEALGEEYSRRYGAKPYKVVTDGLETLPSVRRTTQEGFRIYFMGLFHIAYEENLRALLEALLLLESKSPGLESKVTCRCEYIRPHVWKDAKQVEVLPFAGEDQIAEDLTDADLLYLPMPFGRDHENFTRFSVSTKMVTYVGSGLPIVYHGPASSAAYSILHRDNAAIFLTTLDPREIADSLAKLTSAARDTVVNNALALAARDFMAADQTQKFWGTICDHISKR